MPHLGVGDELEYALYHAEPRAQYRHDREFFAREGEYARLRDGGLYLSLFERQVARDLINHEPGDLLHKVAEIF
ncbi:hypothetical protein SDC9_127451 [bioreactor metagenome]|uniref:Uncharacterized protein n=1 Tax=bioreactor metagenome TaxID=1076179 RepID=A0A645CU16_9ZZZZ